MMKIEARVMGRNREVTFNARGRESAFRTAARKLGLGGAGVAICPVKVGTSQWQCEVSRKGFVVGSMMVVVTT